MIDLPAHQLAHAPRLSFRGRSVEHRQGVFHGGQRVAQFVREHRDELGLALVGLAQRALGRADGRDVRGHHRHGGGSAVSAVHRGEHCLPHPLGVVGARRDLRRPGGTHLEDVPDRLDKSRRGLVGKSVRA